MTEYKYFLLIGLKTDPLLIEKYPEGGVQFSSVFTTDEEVAYSVVLTQDDEDSFPLGMVLISSQNPRSVLEGMHYGHAIITLLPISHFCTAKIYDEFSMLPVGNDAYKALSRPWMLSEITSNCRKEIEEWYPGRTFFEQSFGTYTIGSLSWIESVAPYLKRYITDSAFQRGCSYLFLSMSELGVDACDWRENNYDDEFYRFVSIANAESAFLNAFKTIESIVGEPSKNRTKAKISKRLAEKEIEVDKVVGYRRNKGSVLDKIVKYHKLRDQIAAHGLGKMKRGLKMSEIIDLQSLARYLLLAPYS